MTHGISLVTWMTQWSLYQGPYQPLLVSLGFQWPNLMEPYFTHYPLRCIFGPSVAYFTFIRVQSSIVKCSSGVFYVTILVFYYVDYLILVCHPSRNLSVHLMLGLISITRVRRHHPMCNMGERNQQWNTIHLLSMMRKYTFKTSLLFNFLFFKSK